MVTSGGYVGAVPTSSRSRALRTDSLEDLHGPDATRTPVVLRNRRVLYSATTAFLALVVAAAALGPVTDIDTFGVETRRTRAAGDGYELEVAYGSVSRPGMATPLEIEVSRPGGFDDVVSIAVDHDYLTIWDENGFYPTPSSETTAGNWIIWEFEPPAGSTLRFTYDARISPAVQRSAHGRVAVMEANVPVVSVDFDTRILP